MPPQAARVVVPTGLLDATVRAALPFAEQPAAALASTAAVALARGVVHAMTITRMKILGAAILSCALATGGLRTVAFAFAFGGAGQGRDPNAPGTRAPADPTERAGNALQRRAVNRRVRDFPEARDLSSPEAALAAWNRAVARKDFQAVFALGARTLGLRDVEAERERWRRRDQKENVVFSAALLDAEILELATYRGDLAVVTSRLGWLAGVGRDPFSNRTFGRIDGLWKNLGEDRLPSLDAARESIDLKKEDLWRMYTTLREGAGLAAKPSGSGLADLKGPFLPMAEGEPTGIGAEKAELMGRVEWAFLHGGRDITARKSIAWGDVRNDGKGKRSIRYTFEATVWGRDVYVMNKIFSFDAKGNLLSMDDEPGYPRKRADAPVNVGSSEGLKALVEGYFANNFRDITTARVAGMG